MHNPMTQLGETLAELVVEPQARAQLYLRADGKEDALIARFADRVELMHADLRDVTEEFRRSWRPVDAEADRENADGMREVERLARVGARHWEQIGNGKAANVVETLAAGPLG